MPLISVLLPFYNSDRTLGEAVDSILSQTIADFELILVNDGSTDGSLAVAQERASGDPRIRVVGDDRNRGIVTRLNEGLALCRGEFVARMDADDWSFPNRFAAQLEYLERHDRVVAVSGAFVTKSDGGSKSEVHSPDCDAQARRLESSGA